MVPAAVESAVLAAQEGSLPDLPDPDAVADAVAQMEASVRAHWEMYQARIENARGVLADALAEQKALVESYPQFFPEEQPAAQPRPGAHPSVEQRNVVLRAIAEHPGSTYRQLSRRLTMSRSWVARIIQVINEQGDYVARGRSGREHTWTVTPAGEQFLNRGGFHS